jgi:hypothetical protein
MRKLSSFDGDVPLINAAQPAFKKSSIIRMSITEEVDEEEEEEGLRETNSTHASSDGVSNDVKPKDAVSLRRLSKVPGNNFHLNEGGGSSPTSGSKGGMRRLSSMPEMKEGRTSSLPSEIVQSSSLAPITKLVSATDDSVTVENNSNQTQSQPSLSKTSEIPPSMTPAAMKDSSTTSIGPAVVKDSEPSPPGNPS